MTMQSSGAASHPRPLSRGAMLFGIAGALLLVLWGTSYWWRLAIGVGLPDGGARRHDGAAFISYFGAISAHVGGRRCFGPSETWPAPQNWRPIWFTAIRGGHGMRIEVIDEEFPDSFTHGLLAFGASEDRFIVDRFPYVELSWTATVPLWLLVLLFWAWPAMQLGRRRRRRRLGLCVRCGYDVRDCPARCPECGAGGGGLSSYPHKP